MSVEVIGGLPDGTQIGCDGFNLFTGVLTPAVQDVNGNVTPSSIAWTQLTGYTSATNLYPPANPGGV